MYEIFVVSYQGNPPSEPLSAQFGREGGSIGRAPVNTLVLSDPNRFVSRIQAKVTFDGVRMTIANASTANPLLVNDRELEAGARAPLADGDELRVGLYLLRIRQVAPESAELIASPNAVPPPVTPLLNAIPPPKVASASPGCLDPLQLQFGDTGTDAFADLMANPVGLGPAAVADPGRSPSHPDPSSSIPNRPSKPSIHDGSAPAGVVPIVDVGPTLEGRRPAPGPESPRVVNDAPRIPDSVWDGLVGHSPASEAPLRPLPVLPANFDPFAEPSNNARNAENPFAEFAQSGIALDSLDKLDTSVDKLFGDAPLQAGHLDSVIPDPNAIAPDPLGRHDSLDPLAAFDDNESSSRIPDPAFSRSERDDVSELEAFFRPPTAHFDQTAGSRGEGALLEPNVPEIGLLPQAAGTPNAASQDHVSMTRALAGTTRPQSGSQTSDSRPSENSLPAHFAQSVDPEYVSRLLQELLVGAGIPNANLKEGLTPEMMRRIGAMLAAAVQGTIELIAARALLKREVKADVTIIASTRNNPLKFLPDAESALLQMFGSRIPGFMSPVEAMQDAFKDLRAHEVGLIAGMHAALAQVLHRFEPSELEKRLKPPGVLEGLLPNSHKARLWEEFAEMYVDISREAQDDFQSLFGKSFLQAYDDEVSRLKGH